jgi:hypothetical protein
MMRRVIASLRNHAHHGDVRREDYALVNRGF